MKLFAYYFLVFGLVITAACSTDVETNAPYQDVPVVYGVLNPDSAFQYIRITKGFLNADGTDARDIALKNPDAYYYAADELDVKLLATYDNKVDTVASFSQITNNNKMADGDFAYPEQKLYISQGPVDLDVARFNLLPTQQKRILFKVWVRNLKTNKVVVANTSLVGAYTMASPSEQSPGSSVNDFDFYVEKGSTNNFIAISPAPTNASVFKANLKINIREVFKDGTTKDTSILWTNIASPLTVGNSNNINKDIEANGFFELMLSSLKNKPNLDYRVFVPSEFYFYAGNSDYQRYLQLLNNYSPISQTRPIYNNIEGGLGLWTSVRNKKIAVRISNRTVDEMNFVTNNQPRRADLFNLKFKSN